MCDGGVDRSPLPLVKFEKKFQTVCDILDWTKPYYFKNKGFLAISSVPQTFLVLLCKNCILIVILGKVKVQRALHV